MPCDTVRTITTDLGKANWDRLAEVMAKEGWNVSSRTDTTMRAYKGGASITLTAGDGEAEVSGIYGTDAEKVLAGLKRQYAAKTVTDAAKRFGFRVQGQETKGETVRIRMGK